MIIMNEGPPKYVYISREDYNQLMELMEFKEVKEMTTEEKQEEDNKALKTIKDMSKKAVKAGKNTMKALKKLNKDRPQKQLKVLVSLDLWRDSDIQEYTGVTRVRKTFRYLIIYMDKHKIYIPLNRMESYEVLEIVKL